MSTAPHSPAFIVMHDGSAIMVLTPGEVHGLLGLAKHCEPVLADRAKSIEVLGTAATIDATERALRLLKSVSAESLKVKPRTARVGSKFLKGGAS